MKFTGTIHRSFHTNRAGNWMAGILTLDDETARREGKSEVKFAGKVAADVGDRLEIEGEWKQGKFGLEVDVTSGRAIMDESPEGLVTLLAQDPRFKGLGPARARKVVEAAGEIDEDLGRALAKHPERISQASGVKVDVVLNAAEIWNGRRSFFESLAALADQGWSNSQANAIIESIGENAPALIKSNPYFLIGQVPRFGFRTVDTVALKMGFKKNAPDRLFAGVGYCMEQVCNDGHTWTNRAGLIASCVEELRPDTLEAEVEIEDAIEKLIEEQIFHVDVSPLGKEVIAGADLARTEFGVFEDLIAGLQDATSSRFLLDGDRARGVVPTLNVGQREALEGLSNFRFGVMSGGAGVGKTYTIRAICEVAEENGLKVKLAAPTGKAARKLSDSTGRTASTMHRLLEPKFVDKLRSFKFTRNARNPIEADLVVIDEISMTDVRLMSSVLEALPDGCRLFLVGDHHQIPSVSAGAILRDILSARNTFPGAIHVLTEVVRQAGVLARNTTAILDGVVVKSESRPWGIVKTTERNDEGGAAMVATVVEALVTAPNSALTMDFDVQVLAPMRKGPLGVWKLNVHLQRLRHRLLGNPEPPPTDEGKSPKPLIGDRVIWTRNDYELELFNGTQAIVVGLPKGGAMELFTDDAREVTVEPEKRNRVEVCYAMTIHKSQGSEWPAVVLIASSSHWHMHDRNLLYTGASRAADTLTIVGDTSGMTHFAKTLKSHVRQTFGAFMVHGWRPGDGSPTSASVRLTAKHKSEADPIFADDDLPF